MWWMSVICRCSLFFNSVMVGLSDAAGLFEDSLSEGNMGTNQQPPPCLPPCLPLLPLLPLAFRESLAQEHRKLWKCLSRAGEGHVRLLSADWMRTVTLAQRRDGELHLIVSLWWRRRRRSVSSACPPAHTHVWTKWTAARQETLQQPPRSLDPTPNWSSITHMQIQTSFISLHRTNTEWMLDIKQ